MSNQITLTTPVKHTVNGAKMPNATASLIWMQYRDTQMPALRINGTMGQWFVTTLLGMDTNRFEPERYEVPKEIHINLGAAHVCTNVDELLHEVIWLLAKGVTHAA